MSQNLEINSCVGVSFSVTLQTVDLQFYENQTPAQVFSSEFCKIYQGRFFTEYLWTLIFHLFWSKLYN